MYFRAPEPLAMKKILLFLICLPQLLLAQVDFNYVSPLEYGRFYAMDVDSAGNIVAVGSYISCADALINVFDEAGTLQWQYSNNRYHVNPITDVLFDSDGNIVVVGVENKSDDVGHPEDGFFLLKLDAKGDTLIHANHPTGNFAISYRAFILAQRDSSYLVSMNDHLYWLGKNGELLSQQQISIGRVSGLDFAPMDHFIVHNKEEAQLFDWSGTLIKSYETSGTFIDLSFANDTTWLLLDHQLWAIHRPDELPKIDTLPVRFETAKIAARKMGEGVVLYTKNEDKQIFFEYKNGNWDTLSIQPTLGTNLNAFMVRDSIYYFAGTDLWHVPNIRKPLYGAYISATTQKKNPLNEQRSDVSLEFITAEAIGDKDTSDYIRGYPNIMDTIAYKISQRFRATVTIMNTGNRTMNSFVLSSEWLGGFNCGQSYDYHYIDSLDLEPGGIYSFTIPVNHYYYKRIGKASENQNRCFYVSAPNNQFDAQIENNYSCVTLVNKVKKRFTLDARLNVFPNPASTILNIRLNAPNPIQQIILFDLQGQRTAVEITLQGKEARLERGNLPAGIYFLKVFTKEGIGSQKVIFQ
ncbi:MAG: hypothetical protein Sapg2KO_33760 [Saprospiraceae bacterium]